MANGTSGELKGRVIGVGQERVSGDKAQIALIDDYLRCQGRCGGSDQRYEAKRQANTDQAVVIPVPPPDGEEQGSGMEAKPPLTQVRGGLLQPNSILPSQYFAPRRRLTEHGLMIAVLQDAIECVAEYRAAKDCRGRRLFREATQWLLAEQTDWPYSFKCICGVLDLDAHAVRSAVGVLERPSVLVSREIQNATPAYAICKKSPALQKVNHDSMTAHHPPRGSAGGVHARCGA